MDVGTIARQLGSCGFAVVENALAPELLSRLDDRCDPSDTVRFLPSGMGRGTGRSNDAVIRGDVVSWLEHAKEADHGYLTVMEDLRVCLNEQLYLGLFDYECHYAIYDSGAHYQRHVDALRGQKNRLLSTVVYLNSAWALADGGELILYRGADPSPVARILPQPGLMVLFLSEDFPHEVLAATRSRHSIAGWFRGRAAS